MLPGLCACASLNIQEYAILEKSFQRCQKLPIVQSESSDDWILFEQKKSFIKVGLSLFHMAQDRVQKVSFLSGL